MKKILKLLLICLLLIPIIGSFNTEQISGETSCGLEYEVSYIEDDGSFTNKGCYSDFESAKKAMQEFGEDYVVRQDASLSPSKIIAMNSGVAYSYPGRANSKTLNIYQNNSERSIYYKQTYIANHYEMYYYDTEKYFIDKNNHGVGIIKVNINGFEGYTDLEYTDLVPSKFLDKGIAIYLGGNNDYEEEDAFLVKTHRNYYEVINNGSYKDLVFHYYRAYPEKNGEANSASFVIGKASDQMKIGIKYYSIDGINFYTNEDLSGTCITYYNYYQFLPLRSKTNIDASVFNDYLKSYSNSVMANHGEDFINAQNQYGVNALLLFAMAAHESAFGTSGYARNYNNLFGWNAFDASPSSASHFESINTCINEQAGINLRGYLDITDGRFFSSSLGNKGSGLNVKYASDPYWGMKIAGIAYTIDKTSQNKNGSYTDLDKYELALINTFDIDVKKEAKDDSQTLYTTQYGPYYQKDFIVICLERQDAYTKIQSTNAIDENGNIKTHRTPITAGNLNPISTYDYDLSVAYIKNDYLTSLKDVTNNVEIIDENLSAFSSIDDLKIENNNLIISGCAFIKGMDFANKNNIKHEILLKNISNNNTVKSFIANTKEYAGIKFNDNHVYNYVGYDVKISLADINSGNYYLDINIINNQISMSTNLISNNDAYANINTSLNNLYYHLSTNEIYAYRVELNVDSLPDMINYNSINKPSTRLSLFSFDDFKLNNDGDLNIYGQAMIYYLNYNNQDDIKYTIYLIDDKDNYLEIACTTLKSNFDYQKLLKSSFNMDNICFEAKANIKDLNKGYYQLLIKIENGNYVDYLEMTTISMLDVPEININNKTFRFFVSKIRDRIMLEVR